MKNIKLRLLRKYKIIPFVLIGCLQSQAIANEINYDFSKNWSFGINTIYSKTNFKFHYGENILSSKSQLGLNPFVRQMFNDNWGIEAGLEIYKNMKRTARVEAGNTVAGIYLEPLFRFRSYKTNINQNHLYLAGIAKMRFLECNNSLNLMLGVSLSKLNAKFNMFEDGFGASDITRTFKKSKLIPIVKATFEHKLNSNFSVQALTVWKGMSAFKVKSKENPNGPTEIRLKNSLGLGLGVTYNI